MPLKYFKSTIVDIKSTPLLPSLLDIYLLKKLDHLSYRISHILYLADCISLVPFNMFFYSLCKLAYLKAWPDSASIIFPRIFNMSCRVKCIFKSIVSLDCKISLPIGLCWVSFTTNHFLLYRQTFEPPICVSTVIHWNWTRVYYIITFKLMTYMYYSAEKSNVCHTLSSITKIPLFAFKLFF